MSRDRKLAPYNERGDLLSVPRVRHLWDAETRRSTRLDESLWRPIVPFGARLTLMDYQRGKSVARFIWRDEQGHRFPMFVGDMFATIKLRGTLAGTTVATWWIVQKRGQAYGLRPATLAEVDDYQRSTRAEA